MAGNGDMQKHPNDTTSITGVLQRMRGTRGDIAFEKLLAISRPKLLRIARAQGRSKPDPAHSPTDLLQEFSVRLWNSRRECAFAERESFFRFARTVMRNFFRDHVARYTAKKRGGNLVKVSVDENLNLLNSGAFHTHDSVLLQALDSLTPEQRQVFELRYFDGFTEEETAGMLGISVDAVQRRRKVACTILAKELGSWRPKT